MSESRRTVVKLEPKPDPNDWRVIVTPRAAGDFGWFSTTLIQNNERQAKDKQDQMIDAIKRHVDDVHHVQIECSWLCPVCGVSRLTRSGAVECCYEGDEDESE